ncbi:choice-of-anchor D domain-containing protein [Roseibacillus persicicus]|uniref:choice-of-anchor D domain-containing protein n=1 Tax=Roseibacillus persicicus TaxID=454148 RepID=UPI00398A77AB
MKKLLQFLTSLFVALLTQQAHAVPNIIIEGSDGIGWPNISDNDLNPNQVVTDFDREFCNESKDRTYRIRNTGNQTLTVFVNGNSPSSTSSQFSFPGFPSSNFTIAAGSQRVFTIRYTPLTHGTRQTTIRIDSNDPDAESVYTFAVEGEGRCGEASVYYNPTSGGDVLTLDGDSTPSTSAGTNFGSVSVGSDIERDFYIRNSSAAPDVLRIRNPRLTGSGAAHFQIVSLGTSNLGVGNNRNFQIRFAPTSAGTKTASFVFDNNDVGESPYNFTITGVGTAFPEISLEGKRDQFGTTFDPITDGQSVPNSADGTLFDNTAVGSSRDSVIRIHNTGNATLTLQNRSITGTGAAHFGTVGFSTASIPAGGSRDFDIRFTPLEAGTHTATFSFGNNDSNENPFNFTIRGVGEAPEIRISGRPNVGTGGYDNIADGETTVRTSEGTDFGSVRVSSGSNTNEFKITNDGNDGLNLSNPRITGSGASHFSFTGVNSAFNIAAGNDREFTITFNPSSLGTKNATFLVDSNDPNEQTYSFALQGVGFGIPEIRVQGRRDVTGTFLTEIFDNDTTPRSTDGTLFANTDVGSTYNMLVRVHNDGDDTLSIGSRGFSGPDANQFNTAGFPTNGSIAPGGSVDFQIRFTPTSFGTKNATFTFVNGDSNENPFNFAIQATAEAPEIQVAGHLPGEAFLDIADGDTTPREADGTDFGEANVTGVGNEAQREFRVSNLGNVNLNIESGTTITGPAAGDYSISGLFAGNPFVNIGEGKTQNFVITFDPSTTGVRNATVSIANNDPDEDPYTFALTGVGIGSPEIRVQGRRDVVGTTLTQINDGDTTPRSNDGTLFADTEVGDTYEMLVRLHNDGDGVLNLGNRSFSGSGASQFNTVGFPANGTLAPGDRIDFNIRFTPTSFGTKTAVFSFGNDDSDENPFNFTIEGNAEASEIEVLGRGVASQFGPILDGDNSPRVADGTDFDTTRVGFDETYQFRIDNSGNKVLRITSRQFIGDTENEFSVSGLLPITGVRTIQPGESHFFNITFEPNNVGVENVIFELRNDDPDEDPYTFSMRGEGIGDPEIRVRGLTSTGIPFDISDNDLDPNQDVTQFGTVTLGQTKTRNYRVVNDGTDTLSMSSIVSSEPEFTISGLSANIPVGGSDDFTITFTPTSTDEVETIITIRSNDPTGRDPYTFALVGTGEGPEMEVRGGGSTFSELISDGDSTPRSADGTLFGEVNPNGGSLIVPFQIRNTGTTNLVINDKSVLGDHASDFTIRSLSTSPLNVTIAPGGTREFEVEFDPTDTGTRNAVIVLESNDADEDPYSFAVRGIGQDPGLLPEIRVVSNAGGLLIANGDSSPRLSDGTDFGTLTVGEASATQSFVIHNDGDADLEIYGLTVNNAVYTNTTPATIPPGQQRPFNVTLSTDLSGVQDGVVSIFSNDTTASSYTFAITAEIEEATGSLAITGFDINGNDASVTFTSIPGESYSIKKSTTLGANSWVTVPGFGNIAGSNSPQTINLPNIINLPTDPKAFFRLEKNL